MRHKQAKKGDKPSTLPRVRKAYGERLDAHVEMWEEVYPRTDKHQALPTQLSSDKERALPRVYRLYKKGWRCSWVTLRALGFPDLRLEDAGTKLSAVKGVKVNGASVEEGYWLYKVDGSDRDDVIERLRLINVAALLVRTH